MKPQRKKGEGRKSEQHSSHAQPKPSSVQSVVGGVHLQSDSTATNEHARTDHQPFPNSSSARNQPSVHPPSVPINRLHQFKTLTVVIRDDYLPSSPKVYLTITGSGGNLYSLSARVQHYQPPSLKVTINRRHSKRNP